MNKPIDEHFVSSGSKAICKYCSKEISNQGLAKVYHLSYCLKKGETTRANQ